MKKYVILLVALVVSAALQAATERVIADADMVNAIRNQPEHVLEFAKASLTEEEYAAFQEALFPPPTDSEKKEQLTAVKVQLERLGVSTKAVEDEVKAIEQKMAVEAAEATISSAEPQAEAVKK